MKNAIVKTALVSAVLTFGAGCCAAAESSAAASALPRSTGNTKRTPARIEPVDINSASKEALMKLKGIGAAEAERIVAGRPYLSKAHLVTHKVIPRGIYEQIRRQIIAIQIPAAGNK